jgi:hypothetical protein
LESQLESLKQLKNKSPKEYDKYKYTLELYEAIEFTRKWMKQRKWLVANGVKFNHYEDEIKYNEITVKFNLHMKA